MADEASTRFPFINLEKALVRARAMYEGDRSGKPMSVPTAFELWGYSPKSSGGFQTVGALKGYGLIEDEGANAERRVRITPSARRYFLDERDDVRRGMLADFALNPPLFRVLWVKDKWSDGIPADPVARSHLKIERGLNDQSARAVLSILRENAQFVGLKAGLVPEEPLESEPSAEATPMPEAEPVRGRNMETAEFQAKPESISSSMAFAERGAPEVRIVGDRVMIAANVDLRGLRKLQRQLGMFEKMLVMSDEDEEYDEEVKNLV